MDTEKDKNTINGLYVMLIISTIASFVPEQTAQMFSIILILVVLGGAYYYKMRDSEDGLVYNHMTYMIGTIWIGSTLILVGLIAMLFWLYAKGDHSLVNSMIAQVQNGQMVTEADMQGLTADYMAMNMNLLIKSSLVTMGPGVLYVVYRVANGFSRSLRGYRIAKPNSWL